MHKYYGQQRTTTKVIYVVPLNDCFCYLLMSYYYLISCQVHLVREKITWPGARIKKKGEGMPNYDNNNAKGDLYITFDVEFPRGGLEDSEKEGMSHYIFWVTMSERSAFTFVTNIN